MIFQADKLYSENLEESKMSDRNRIENEFKTNELKTNLKRIKVQIEKGNRSPKNKINCPNRKGK